MFKGIDLSSDTATRPTAAMKQAMMAAELGDEQKGEDPTTRQLEQRVADLLGKSAAMFFPSATLANEIALQLLCEPGDEMIAAANCHLFVAEAGGPAIHAGIMPRPIAVENGIFDGDEVRKAYRWSKGPHYPVTKLVSVENTANMGGGVAWPMENLTSVLTAAKELGLKTHLDGARLFNAAIKTGVPVGALASGFDAITVCLSKGLGCPVGAVLAFDKEGYGKVRRLKQLMGGALRQSGMLAAAGIYALEHHVSRLREDHANAALLAEQFSQIPALGVRDKSPSTNMVFFDWRSSKLSPDQFSELCMEKGVRFSRIGAMQFRAVTHLDIKPEDILQAVAVVKSIGL